MDGQTQRLIEKLEGLLRETAETAAELQRRQHDPCKPRRYLDIERQAHATGRRLSCQIQRQAVRDVAAEADPEAACPRCGATCSIWTAARPLTSIDGEVETLEPVARCNRCRRSFFPSA